MDYREFLSKPKSMLIAPAGYGKTHTIAECLNHSEGKVLILTHTHAGIGSIREKVAKAGISPKKCNIETITGYAQKYTEAFYRGSDVPEQENSKEYYPFIVKRAAEIVKYRLAKDIIQASYSALIVDEYQDCTSTQHELITNLSAILPTSILGDHLQGIFNFSGDSLVDLNDTSQMDGFISNKYELTEPRRWENTNKPLGECLKQIREKIETRSGINLRDYIPTIEVLVCEEIDIFNPTKAYPKRIRKLIEDETSLLLLHPVSHSVGPRKKLVSLFNNSIYMIESIDDSDFYHISRKLDGLTTINTEAVLFDVASQFFGITDLKNWLKETGFVTSRDPERKKIINSLKLEIEEYRRDNNLTHILKVLKDLKQQSKMRCSRSELLSSVYKAIENATHDKSTVYQGMINHRNKIRRMGRKVIGKCIGTTLLTKGLEFDTVVILDAHKFTSEKHLYVALTRARKNLVVFTKSASLNPY